MSKLKVHIILDRSGSMSSCREEAMKGVNTYIEELKSTDPDIKLSLTLFDSESIDLVVDKVKVSKVEPLTSATFRPRGTTPLYDAIAKVVSDLSDQPGKKKALVILTDGYENASKEHTKESIKKILDEKQEKENWLVTYLGANQDALKEGGSFGTLQGTTANFSVSAFSGAMRGVAASTMRYASGTLKDAAYTDKERKDMVAEKE